MARTIVKRKLNDIKMLVEGEDRRKKCEDTNITGKKE